MLYCLCQTVMSSLENSFSWPGSFNDRVSIECLTYLEATHFRDQKPFRPRRFKENPVTKTLLGAESF